MRPRSRSALPNTIEDVKTNTSTYQKILLFYAKAQAPPFRALTQDVVRTICRYFPPYRFMPAVWERKFLCFDLRSSYCGVFCHPELFDLRAPLCLLDEVNLMFFPARESNRLVRSMSMFRFLISVEQPTLESRTGQGVVRHGDSVWLFGGMGLSDALNTCEKFDLRKRQWEPAEPCLYAHHTFQPCPHKADIFLPNAVGRSLPLEIYDTVRERPRLVRSALISPQEWLAFFESDRLILVSRDSSVRILSLATGKEQRTKLNCECATQVDTLPIRIRNSLFFVSLGKLQHLNFESIAGYKI